MSEEKFSNFEKAAKEAADSFNAIKNAKGTLIGYSGGPSAFKQALTENYFKYEEAGFQPSASLPWDDENSNPLQDIKNFAAATKNFNIKFKHPSEEAIKLLTQGGTVDVETFDFVEEEKSLATKLCEWKSEQPDRVVYGIEIPHAVKGKVPCPDCLDTVSFLQSPGLPF